MAEHEVYLSLGSNLGDRAENLRQGLRLLAQGGVQLQAISRVYQTAPWGGVPQPDFYNLAALVSTDLPPPPLLQLASAEAVREAARINVRILDFFIMTSKKQSVFKFYRTRRSRMPRRRPTEKDYPLTAPIMTPLTKYFWTKG